MGFEEAYKNFRREVWPEVRMFFIDAWTYCTGIWEKIPNSIQNVLTAIFYIAILGIALSLIKVSNPHFKWGFNSDPSGV